MRTNFYSRPIPIIAILWEHALFRGVKRAVFRTGSLDTTGFDRVTSAIGIHPGPDYDWFRAAYGFEPTVTFLADGGRELLTLGVGAYNDLSSLGINDAITEPVFNLQKQVFATEGVRPTSTASRINDIPYIVYVYPTLNDPRPEGPTLQLVEETSDIGRDYGQQFNDSAKIVAVEPGPTWTCDRFVAFHRDADWKGGSIRLQAGKLEYARFAHSWPENTTEDAYHFLNQISSIEFGTNRCVPLDVEWMKALLNHDDLWKPPAPPSSRALAFGKKKTTV